MDPVDPLASDQAIVVQHIERSHPGVTEAYSDSICEAAHVCLARHHEPPHQFTVVIYGEADAATFNWVMPSERARASHAYELDATKDGAYAISLLCIERKLGLVAIGQAQAGTGADWYLAPSGRGTDEYGAPDLDEPGVRRLEVSGTDTGPVGHRSRVKRRQLARGSFCHSRDSSCGRLFASHYHS